jgi:hypothetical protein
MLGTEPRNNSENLLELQMQSAAPLILGSEKKILGGVRTRYLRNSMGLFNWVRYHNEGPDRILSVENVVAERNIWNEAISATRIDDSATITINNPPGPHLFRANICLSRNRHLICPPERKSRRIFR